jgi:hypothetical protein
MKWFRSHIDRCSWMALFALTIQFALSFGHFHPVTAQSTATVALGSLASERSLANSDASRHSAQLPAPKPDSGDHTGDICDICAVMAMAATALFAAPPVLLQPQAVEFSYPAIEGESVLAASVRVAFQPRGPPLS